MVHSPFINWLPGLRDIERFDRNGFLIVPHIVVPDRARALIACYPSFFDGRFPTGISPEKWTRVDSNARVPKPDGEKKPGGRTHVLAFFPPTRTSKDDHAVVGLVRCEVFYRCIALEAAWCGGCSISLRQQLYAMEHSTHHEGFMDCAR